MGIKKSVVEKEENKTYYVNREETEEVVEKRGQEK